MNKKLNGSILTASLAALLLNSGGTAQAALPGAPLRLQEAEDRALQVDPMVAAYGERSEAQTHRATAAQTLPDPKLKLGLMNVPTDTFDLEQEAMTQMQVGVVQAFPRGKTRAIKSERARVMAGGEQARVQERRRLVLREVRTAWLEAFYWKQAAGIVNKNRALFRQLVEITEGRYAAGRRNQQDYISAQLELGVLDDRDIKIRSKEEVARARLAKWVGHGSAYRELPAELPQLPPPGAVQEVEQSLGAHPTLRVARAQVDANMQGVALARQTYKPGWMLDVTYGFRGGENPNGTSRADFLSAMVLLEVPLFTGKRQDQQLDASQQELSAAQHMYDEQLSMLRRMFDTAHAQWERLGMRVEHFDAVLLPRARENTVAALNAYQSERGDFTSLVRARIRQFETELNALRVRVDRASAQAKLLYLVGDER
ncbi:MAG: TolC family protein [Pseudomonadota bacterium]|nr:MAG: TolC family protein [Pseudomonadota bacterium]